MSDDDADILSDDDPLPVPPASPHTRGVTHAFQSAAARDASASRAFEADHTAAIVLEYDGTRFCGWTRQPGLPSIEGELLAAFAVLSSEVLEWRCAGRTDAGVHASAQVVSLAWNGPISPERIERVLNSYLPADIAIRRAVQCDPAFDARHDATARSYEFRILVSPSHAPLRARFVLHHPRPLDRDLLHACAAAIVGTHDFIAFTPTKTLHRFFHRTVLAAAWHERGDELVFSITGNAFLRNMVRILMGSMLAVGRGDMTLFHFQSLLAGAPRSQAYSTALPTGLCLVDVGYPPALDPFA